MEKVFFQQDITLEHIASNAWKVYWNIVGNHELIVS